jgi:hypothetical protein
MRETATPPSGFHLPWGGKFEKGKLPPARKTAAKSLRALSEGFTWRGRVRLALAFEVAREVFERAREAKQPEGMTEHGLRLHFEPYGETDGKNGGAYIRGAQNWPARPEKIRWRSDRNDNRKNERARLDAILKEGRKRSA